jgi:hypothetical protein
MRPELCLRSPGAFWLDKEPEDEKKALKTAFLNKRVCGAWLVWVAAVILIGKLAGGSQLISMPVFSFGYMAGIFGILSNKKLARRLSFGPPTTKQNRLTLVSIRCGMGIFHFK